MEKRKSFAIEMAYIYINFTPRGTPIWRTLICAEFMTSRETQEYPSYSVKNLYLRVSTCRSELEIGKLITRKFFRIAQLQHLTNKIFLFQKCKKSAFGILYILRYNWVNLVLLFIIRSTKISPFKVWRLKRGHCHGIFISFVALSRESWFYLKLRINPRLSYFRHSGSISLNYNKYSWKACPVCFKTDFFM